MFTLCPGHYNKKESNIEISQIFVLTHNALFHHYVTAGYDDPRHYNYFSFFEVKKKNEISAIIPSLKELNGNIINKNPQKSYYTSLWDAYNEVDSSNALITLMRQILNSYFIQTCGRTEEDIIDDLTINHADKFIVGSDKDHSVYDLFAVSQHYGGTGFGHYTAICENFGKWYCYDDGCVHEVDKTKVNSSAAYVLFYRRKTD